MANDHGGIRDDEPNGDVDDEVRGRGDEADDDDGDLEELDELDETDDMDDE